MARATGYGRAVGRWARSYPLAPRYRQDELIALTTADGVRLRAAFLHGPATAPFTLVLAHGLVNSSRSPRIHAFARMLQSEVHVIVPDLRGHGASGGHTSLGLFEPYDIAAAVAAAPPDLPVVTMGSSLGGAAVIRHAGLIGGVAGVVSLSAPAWSGPHDRPGSDRAQRLLTSRAGRRLAAHLFRTRIPDSCLDIPDAREVAASVSPAFLVVVHDPDDHYFGEDHARAIFGWANEPKKLWLLPGVGHGTDLLTPDFAARLLEELRPRVTRSG
jgi:pimeloyl-ACP methyl ester carboxylesterase